MDKQQKRNTVIVLIIFAFILGISLHHLLPARQNAAASSEGIVKVAVVYYYSPSIAAKHPEKIKAIQTPSGEKEEYTFVHKFEKCGNIDPIYQDFFGERDDWPIGTYEKLYPSDGSERELLPPEESYGDWDVVHIEMIEKPWTFQGIPFQE